MNKDELRYKYKIKRKYFQHSAREVADGNIAAAVLEELGKYQSFLVYFSYGSEADTHALISSLLSCGKKVYLPRVEGQNIAAVPYFGREEELVKSVKGIYEPQGQAYTGQIEVCLTPLLAVNEKGKRLGYGGGFYDRYFAAHTDILKVGIGYFLQIANDFQGDEWDEPLDKFICERGIIDFGNE